jgi:hypothetical protein
MWHLICIFFSIHSIFFAVAYIGTNKYKVLIALLVEEEGFTHLFHVYSYFKQSSISMDQEVM